MSKIQGEGVLSYEAVRRFQILDLSPAPAQAPSRKAVLFKRTFDVVFSLFVCIFLLSWIIPVLAVLIKLNSRGPVFFIQKRVGAGGRVFSCVKLRTMHVNRMANCQQASDNDPRITSLGRFLRVSCLDEIPQFLNVLAGHMSIVGPRPHMLKDCKEFSEVIKNYHSRYIVKPGITGMAQVKGYRGLTRDFYDVAHRYKWDMFYVRNMNFHLDMRIIRLTVTSTISTVYSKFFARTPETTVYSFDTPEYLN